LPPAFPGAEGFGALARGGRDGREIAVTNLDDSGPGSLRAAVAEKGARRIVFRVGGTIPLRSPLVVGEPFVSLLGQTAPAPGITLRGSGVIVRTHDAVLQHLRIRPGDDTTEMDALEFYDAERCLVDHCSLGWGTDETCSVVGLSDAITIQHCILSESLDRAQHSMAAIAGGERVTWHHNPFAHCGSRNPRFAMPTLCDFRNNVIYDWGHTAGYGDFERANFVANYYRPGPSTRGAQRHTLPRARRRHRRRTHRSRARAGKGGRHPAAARLDRRPRDRKRARPHRPHPAHRRGSRWLVRMAIGEAGIAGRLCETAEASHRDALQARVPKTAFT
jgi:hypothetical protein